MTYEELLINIELNGFENVLPSVGRICLDKMHWFAVCDDGDCHLFDRYGNEDDISKVKEIYGDMILSDIKKIVIPDGVTSIKRWAFYNCNSLTNVTIGNSVTSIGVYAFFGCSRLTNVMIPDDVTHIGDCAFAGCSNLISVIIGNNVTSIRHDAFFSCNNLKSLIFKGKSLDQIRSMENYPFGIEEKNYLFGIDDESIIKCI